MADLTKEEVLQLLDKTADKLKKGGYNLLLIASKPNGAKMPQNTVAVAEGTSAELISTLVDYATGEPKFMAVMMCAQQQIADLIESAKSQSKE